MAGALATRKAVVRARRRTERRRGRDVRRAHRQCFWTRPWGHVWEHVEGSGGYGYDVARCVGCGWERTRWYD